MIQHIKEQYNYDKLELASSELVPKDFVDMIKRMVTQRMGVVLLERGNIQFISAIDSALISTSDTVTGHLIVIPPEDYGDLHNVLEYVLRKADHGTDAYKSAKKLIGDKENFQL